MGLRYRLLAAAAIGGLVAATCLASASAATEIRFPFDGERFGGDLSVVAIAGGRVSAEAHGGGLAVRFPPRCRVYAGRGCPRVVLESREVPNPGTAQVRFGAAVLMTADDTAAGENLLQKGFSRGHGQFKLQVDGAAGLPSCVLVGTGSRRIYVVTAGVSVADGQWHAIECVRSVSALSILVDGSVLRQIRVPASLSIVNSDPLRIGGKGLSPDNDQFHGAIDDVFVAIGG
jgi:hypothetical protein